jgi:predicted site-specific integrase-resolvase
LFKEKRLNRVCRGKTITLIVVEYTDRAIRFGFCYLETLLERKGRRFEVVNPTENDRKICWLIWSASSLRSLRVYMGSAEPGAKQQPLSSSCTLKR